MPALSPTEQHTSDEGMDVGDQRGFNEVLTCSRYSHEHQLQQIEQYTKRIKRDKSTSAMDDTLSEPLHMLKAKGREGVVTFGYQTISMDDISPPPQPVPPINQPYSNPFLRGTEGPTKNPEEDDLMKIG